MTARSNACSINTLHYDVSGTCFYRFRESGRQQRLGSSCAGQVESRKRENANLRTALYFLAISAMRFNPILRPFADRLRERGKAMTIVAAVMRKLLILAYGVLKSGQAFDPAYAAS